jgi:predicted enzyme related to lactoylglutathione lyase
MKKILGFLMAAITFSAPVHASESAVDTGSDTGKPKFTEQYVMLYYSDIDAAAHFYGNTLGLKAVMEDEWVILYEVLPGSLIGVVKEGGTAYHKVQETNAVMVSIVTEDVDAWYRTIAATAGITVLKEIYNHESVPIRAFLVADPGGYTLEIFQWLR